MWPFNSRKVPAKSLLNGLTDHHSHILPGVDDGVKTLEESLNVLRLYEELGVQAVWCTPHIMEDYPNTTADLKGRFEELLKAYSGNISLRLGSENMLDALFEERLEEDDLLPIGKKGDHLLVETRYFSPPMGLQNILQRIKSKGYHPVLAHPERYMYMGKEEYRRLKDMGVRFQMNLPSLAGMYGEAVRKKAVSLLKSGAIDYFGTDVHSLEMAQNFSGLRVDEISAGRLPQTLQDVPTDL